MRLATWNVNSLKVRMPRVEAWLSDVQPDVVCLQETKLSDAAFPALAFQALGYDSAHYGQGQWNGVAILSRVGLSDARAGFADGGDPDPDARILWRDLRGHPLRQRVRTERPRRSTTSTTSTSWPGCAGCEPTSRPTPRPTSRWW